MASDKSSDNDVIQRQAMDVRAESAYGNLNVLIHLWAAGGYSSSSQASLSEMFGMVSESPQTEQMPFHARSPYSGGSEGLWAFLDPEPPGVVQGSHCF